MVEEPSLEKATRLVRLGGAKQGEVSCFSGIISNYVYVCVWFVVFNSDCLNRVELSSFCIDDQGRYRDRESQT